MSSNFSQDFMGSVDGTFPPHDLVAGGGTNATADTDFNALCRNPLSERLD